MIIWELQVSMLPTARTHLGFRDGSAAALSKAAAHPARGAIKAGEFILCFPNVTAT